MSNAISIVYIVGSRHVIEVNKWVMLGRIEIGCSQWHIGSIDVFLISLPGDVGILQQPREMVGCILMVGTGIVIIEDSEICSGFKPEVVRQAGMEGGWIKVLFAM